MHKLVAYIAGVAAVGAATALAVVGSALVGTAVADAAVPTHTAKVVVRPVHANGTPVTGYTVRTEKIDGFTCTSGSTVAVSRNIDLCGPSASDTVACWKSTSHTVLCLRDPARKQLVRIRYSGTFAASTAPGHADPQRLDLVRAGRSCLIRDGGAWDRVAGHPDWYGTYSCTKYDAYGPTKHNGIVESTNPWYIHLVSGSSSAHDQHVINARVAKAYYVGTAS